MASRQLFTFLLLFRAFPNHTTCGRATESWDLQVEGISLEESRLHLTGNSPLGHMVPPQHIADAVLFLSSDSAASITGEDLNVSAGTVMY